MITIMGIILHKTVDPLYKIKLNSLFFDSKSNEDQIQSVAFIIFFDEHVLTGVFSNISPTETHVQV